MSKIITVVVVVAILAVAIVAAFFLMGILDDEGTTATITVDQPTQGYVQAGSIISIIWISTGDTGDTVNIEYSYEGGLLFTIAVSAPNTGSYYWTIPSDMTPRSTYFIRVTSNNNTSVFDDSAIFSITEGPSYYVGTITVTSPTSESSYVRGTELMIEWTHTGNIGSNLRFEWLHYGGSPVTIGEAGPIVDQGWEIWDIPSDLPAGDDYLIRVTSTSNTSIYDDSEVFSISSEVPSVSLSLSTTEVPFQEKVMVASTSMSQAISNITISLDINGTTYDATVADTSSFVPSLPTGYEVVYIDLADDDNLSAGDYFLVNASSPISPVTIVLNLLWGTENITIGSVSWANSPPIPPYISLIKSTTGVAHQEKIVVADISDSQDYANLKVSFVWNSTSIFTITVPGNLTGTPVATGYSIAFVDMANDGKVSSGDYFLVTSSGGVYDVTFNLLWGGENVNVGMVSWTSF